MTWFASSPAPSAADPSKASGNRRTGDMGEEIAANFLIARDPGDRSLVFVEVEAHRGLAYGVPQLAVPPFKQRQISKAALTWLSKNRLHDSNARFDVNAILLHTDKTHSI